MHSKLWQCKNIIYSFFVVCPLIFTITAKLLNANCVLIINKKKINFFNGRCWCNVRQRTNKIQSCTPVHNVLCNYYTYYCTSVQLPIYYTKQLFHILLNIILYKVFLKIYYRLAVITVYHLNQNIVFRS